MTNEYPVTDTDKQKWLKAGSKIQFPEKASDAVRTIKASWIKAAFDGAGTCNVQVKLENAIVRGPLYLAGLTAARNFEIRRSEFTDVVDFSRFTAKGNLDFRESRFRKSGGKDCSFRYACCERDLILDRAHFESGVSFRSVDVNGNVLAAGVRFDGMAEWKGAHLGRDLVNFPGTTFAGLADFRGVRVTGNLYFGPSGQPAPARTVFWGSARFDYMHIEGRVNFDGVWFRRDVTFEATQVNGTLQLRASNDLGVPCEFNSAANFLDVVVATNLDLNGAQFHGEANFVRLRVGHSLFCRTVRVNGRDIEAAFHQRVQFIDAFIEKNAMFTGARFCPAAQFDRLRAGALWTDSAFFQNGIEMREARIGGSWYSSGVDFSGAALFYGTQIGGGAYFRPRFLDDQTQRARFREVNFDSVTIGGVADFTGAQFRENAVFWDMKVSGNALFREKDGLRTEFMGPADFGRATLSEDADFQNARFTGPAKFNNMTVKGNLKLDSTTFCDKASFHQAATDGAMFRVGYPISRMFPDGEFPDLTAFSFTRLDVADWLLLLPRGSRGTHIPGLDETYSRFEKYYLSVGDQDNADAIYLERRALGRQKILQGWKKHPWVNSVRIIRDVGVERWLLHYGVPSWWLAVPSLLVAILAVILLVATPDAMAVKRAKTEPQAASVPEILCRRPLPEKLVAATGVVAVSVLPGERASSLSQWEPSTRTLLGGSLPIKQVMSWIGYVLSILIGLVFVVLGRLFKPHG